MSVVEKVIDECMADDDELMATKVYAMLKEEYLSLEGSVNTVKRVHMKLGWTAKKISYRRNCLLSAYFLLSA